MKRSSLKKILLVSLVALLIITGCSGDKELSEEKVSDYKNLLNDYYEAYTSGDFEKTITFFNKGFEYEEAGQKYIGEDVIKAAIIKNQHLKHQLEIINMESTNGGMLVTLGNSSYLLKLSGIESYESQEFFTFKKDKIESVITKIDEDDYIYITKMIEANPGIMVEKIEDKIIVSGFIENSSAQAAGMVEDAEILAINNVPVSEYELGVNEAVYRLSGMRDTEVKVTVNQDGVETSYELLRKVN